MTMKKSPFGTLTTFLSAQNQLAQDFRLRNVKPTRLRLQTRSNESLTRDMKRTLLLCSQITLQQSKKHTVERRATPSRTSIPGSPLTIRKLPPTSPRPRHALAN